MDKELKILLDNHKLDQLYKNNLFSIKSICELLGTWDEYSPEEKFKLENITARNSKIDFYRTQIKAYDYYSNQFSKKVDYFCQTGSFDESEYTQLKTEANTMPRLNAKYKSNRKFNQIKQQCIANLEIAYRNWAQEDSDF